MARAADVHGGGLLWVGLCAVDVGPGRRVQDDVGGRIQVGQGQRYVPVGVRERNDIGVRELLPQRTAELAARTGDQDSPVSRSDRIGDFVLQRSTTRGSSHGSPCSSGSEASYSSVTWYSISTSVSASYPCARFPGT